MFWFYLSLSAITLALGASVPISMFRFRRTMTPRTFHFGLWLLLLRLGVAGVYVAWTIHHWR